MMKIYFIAIRLDQEGFHYHTQEFECEEKDKSFVAANKHISKNKIMAVQGLSTHKLQHYSTFCLKEQQQDAMSMLKNHIIQNVKQIKVEIEELYKHLS